MSYLILGAKGQLGREFSAYFQKQGIAYVAHDIDTLDVTNNVDLQKTIENLRPEIIINCVAYNDVDKAESDVENAFLLNAEIVKNLANLANKYQAKLIHYSTDYVFDGIAREPYTEKMPPNPISKYGKSKLKGEEYIQEIGGDYLIIRTSRLYGAGVQNFPYKLTQWAKTKNILTITDDDCAAPTSTAYLLKMTMLSIENGLQGLLHISESLPCSYFQWAKEIVKKENLSVTISAIKAADLNLPAKRPLYSVITSDNPVFANINI